MRKSPYKLIFRRFLIIGLGMMGTSLAASIRKAYRNPIIDGVVKDKSELPFLENLGFFSRIHMAQEWFPDEHHEQTSMAGDSTQNVNNAQMQQARRSLISTYSESSAFAESSQRQLPPQPRNAAIAKDNNGATAPAPKINKWNLYDLIIFAVPVTIELLYLRKIPLKIGNIPTKVLITSLSSCYELIFRFLPKGLNYIGSHPICGTEESGCQNYKEDLFRKQLCFLILPQKKGLRVQKFLLQKFWQKNKMCVSPLSAQDHDEIMALVSHLPHLLAGLLAKWSWKQGVYQRVQQALNSHFKIKSLLRGGIGLAGGGFRDLIRIAGANPEMWADITLANRKRIVPHLQKLIRSLTLLEEQLNLVESENISFWRNWYRDARVSRNRIWGKRK